MWIFSKMATSRSKCGAPKSYKILYGTWIDSRSWNRQNHTNLYIASLYLVGISFFRRIQYRENRLGKRDRQSKNDEKTVKNSEILQGSGFLNNTSVHRLQNFKFMIREAQSSFMYSLQTFSVTVSVPRHAHDVLSTKRVVIKTPNGKRHETENLKCDIHIFVRMTCIYYLCTNHPLIALKM